MRLALPGGRPRPFDPRSKEHLLCSAEESLRLLHREVIDVLAVVNALRAAIPPWALSDFDSSERG